MERARRAENLTRVQHRISTDQRELRNQHRGGVLWFTGLSAAGKSTLAFRLEEALFQRGYQVYVLDGDNVRHGLSVDLSFSPEDRTENIRRIGEVAALLAIAGFICISAFISPYRKDRERARKASAPGFHEIYIKADVATCEQRDPKGLYGQARSGRISDFTGVSAPYEAPINPELIVETADQTVEACLEQLVEYVTERFRC